MTQRTALRPLLTETSTADQSERLGGRLALVDPANLSGAQKALWSRMDQTFAPWAERAGFAAKSLDGRYIGPFNPMLFSPEMGMAFLNLQVEEGRRASLGDRVRQAAILSVGSVWKAPYELYAHSAAARAAGLSDGAIRALVAGEPSSELADDERLAQRVALALTAERRIGDDLYEQAFERFGEKGVVDLAVLAGCYDLVCGILNIFAVPVPEANAHSKEG